VANPTFRYNDLPIAETSILSLMRFLLYYQNITHKQSRQISLGAPVSRQTILRRFSRPAALATWPFPLSTNPRLASWKNRC